MMFGLVGFGLGMTEILVLLVVVLLLFGPSKLPQLGEGIGKMLRGFKREMKALDDEKNENQTESADNKDEIDVTPKASSTKVG